MGVSSKFVRLTVATVLFVVSALGSVAVAQANAQQTEFTLDDCIKAALDHNADVLSKKNSVKTAVWNQWEAWGNVLPSVSTSASYSKSGDVFFIGDTPFDAEHRPLMASDERQA